MNLYKSIIYLGTGIILISFTLSIKFINEKRISSTKYIRIYIFLGVLLCSNAILSTSNLFGLGYFRKDDTHLIQEILFLLQYLSLCFFFIKVLSPSISKFYIKGIKAMALISIIIQVATMLFLYMRNNHFFSNALSNLFLIIFSIVYFKDLLTNKPTQNLFKTANFWVIIGIFFHACVSFPIYALLPTIISSIHTKVYNEQIFSLSNMSLIVMYLFFIKSFLCLKHPQNIL